MGGEGTWVRPGSGKSPQGVPRGDAGPPGGCPKNSWKSIVTMFKFFWKIWTFNFHEFHVYCLIFDISIPQKLIDFPFYYNNIRIFVEKMQFFLKKHIWSQILGTLCPKILPSPDLMGVIFRIKLHWRGIAPHYPPCSPLYPTPWYIYPANLDVPVFVI